MKTTLEKISSVKQKLKIEVPAEVVKNLRSQALAKVQKKAKIQGFRPGKVPLDVVERRFGAEVNQETIEEVVRETYPQAVAEQKLQPISRPHIEPGTLLVDQPFSYTATIEIRPEISVNGYEGMKLEKEEVEISKDQIGEELKKIQQSMTQLEPTPDETILSAGHVATVDFSGKANGKPFKGSQAKDFSIDIGSGGILPEFEKQLQGLKKGTTQSVRFDYPKDYFNKELAGQSAEFSVTVKDIRKKNVPVLNDEFAKDLGSYETLKQVEEMIADRLKQQQEGSIKGELHKKILQELIQKNKFEVPESMIFAELNSMIENLAQELSQRGQKLEDLNIQEVIAHYRPEAEFRTQSFLILDTIANAEKLSVPDADLEQFIENQAKSMQRPKEQLKAYYDSKQLLPSLKLRLLHEKSLEFVLSKAKIKTTKPKKKGS